MLIPLGRISAGQERIFFSSALSSGEVSSNYYNKSCCDKKSIYSTTPTAAPCVNALTTIIPNPLFQEQLDRCSFRKKECLDNILIPSPPPQVERKSSFPLSTLDTSSTSPRYDHPTDLSCFSRKEISKTKTRKEFHCKVSSEFIDDYKTTKSEGFIYTTPQRHKVGCREYSKIYPTSTSRAAPCCLTTNKDLEEKSNNTGTISSNKGGSCKLRPWISNLNRYHSGDITSTRNCTQELRYPPHPNKIFVSSSPIFCNQTYVTKIQGRGAICKSEPVDVIMKGKRNPSNGGGVAAAVNSQSQVRESTDFSPVTHTFIF